MKFKRHDAGHEYYLSLRRQLGEQQNGDFSINEWKGKGLSDRVDIIGHLVDRCEEIVNTRNLSWGAYCDARPDTTNREFNPNTWFNAPLFIKAAIIPPRGTPRWSNDETSDTPDSEVVAW